MPSALRMYNVSLAEIRRSLSAGRLRVDEHHAFQILPRYGGPWYLRPLVTPAWKRVLGRRIGGAMLGARLSSLPGLREIAFRHVFVCTRLA